MAEYLRDKDYIFLHGRKPPETGKAGFTVEDLCDAFLTHREPLIASGELSRSMYDAYFATCARMLKAFGKTALVESLRPDDFDKYRANLANREGSFANRTWSLSPRSSPAIKDGSEPAGYSTLAHDAPGRVA